MNMSKQKNEERTFRRNDSLSSLAQRCRKERRRERARDDAVPQLAPRHHACRDANTTDALRAAPAGGGGGGPPPLPRNVVARRGRCQRQRLGLGLIFLRRE